MIINEVNNEDVEYDWTQYWPLGYTPVSGLQLGFMLVITILWSWPFSFSVHFTDCSLRYPFYEATNKIQCQSPYWCLGRKYPFLSPHLPRQSLYQKLLYATSIINDFTFVNPFWLLLNKFFLCLEIISRISCSVTCPGIEMKLAGLSFPGSSLLPILKIGLIIFYPVLSQLPKITENGFTMASTSSLSTYGFTPSGPLGLCMSHLLKYS